MKQASRKKAIRLAHHWFCVSIRRVAIVITPIATRVSSSANGFLPAIKKHRESLTLLPPGRGPRKREVLLIPRVPNVLISHLLITPGMESTTRMAPRITRALGWQSTRQVFLVHYACSLSSSHAAHTPAGAYAGVPEAAGLFRGWRSVTVIIVPAARGLRKAASSGKAKPPAKKETTQVFASRKLRPAQVSAESLV